MKPSHVRTRILEDHAVLRRHLIELERAVEGMLADAMKAPIVSEVASNLLFDLTRHTELEDAILAPALLDADAWGPVRVSQLLTHHEQQRAQIRELADFYKAPLDLGAVARATADFVNDLREDMEHEERGILSADLLRDDVVTVAAEGG